MTITPSTSMHIQAFHQVDVSSGNSGQYGDGAKQVEQDNNAAGNENGPGHTPDKHWCQEML